MSENPFESVDNIDAEFMERWLGGVKIESLSPKILFDIKQLIQHYASIIVPEEKVNIAFPDGEKESPRASVENLEVKIPTAMLANGRVDETIGAMIHELHHIKLSDKETNIWLSCFNFVCKVLDTLFVGDGNGGYNSLYELVLGDSDLNFEDIMSPEPTNPNALFLRKACDDVAFFLNAIEDVRIDANTPPNLKKYIDKLDSNAFTKFKPKYEDGEFDGEELFPVIYRLLFHHKGYIEDDFIKGKSPDLNDIVNSSPEENASFFFESFKETLREHIENLYQNGELQMPQVGLVSGEGGRDIMDMYLSEKGKDALKEDMNNLLDGKGNSLSDAVDFEDREVDSTNKAKISSGLRDFRKDIEPCKDKPIILSQEFELEIDSYKNIKIHKTTENLSRNGSTSDVDYSCVFVDYA